MPNLEVVEWVTPDALILAPVGELDSDGCKLLRAHLQARLQAWPDMRLVLDLSSVGALATPEAEEVFLEVVASRVRGGTLSFLRPSATCQTLLKRLNVTFLPEAPSDARTLAEVTA